MLLWNTAWLYQGLVSLFSPYISVGWEISHLLHIVPYGDNCEEKSDWIYRFLTCFHVYTIEIGKFHFYTFIPFSLLLFTDPWWTLTYYNMQFIYHLFRLHITLSFAPFPFCTSKRAHKVTKEWYKIDF